MINLEFLAYVLFILNGFVLGSLPFGYIITRLSTSKNILEIGWKKNSTSNVMKNVGKWQGILTGVLDALKGFLAVYIATLAGCPPVVIALAGTAAIAGHNWSPFLDFKGGRGIATLAGAMFCLSPQITIMLLALCGLFTILWTASIGTVIAIMLGITISFPNVDHWTLLLLLIFSIIPISLKRLSPIKEVIPFADHQTLIENRLIFDQDDIPPFRIKPHNINNIVLENNIENNSIDGDYDYINTKNLPTGTVLASTKGKTSKTSSKPSIAKKPKARTTARTVVKKPTAPKEQSQKKEAKTAKKPVATKAVEKKPLAKTIAKKPATVKKVEKKPVTKTVTKKPIAKTVAKKPATAKAIEKKPTRSKPKK
ncbi:MAG: glycerol-3-phosphate acyltransferase [Candidatus Pacebacteria bacterium]|nr:glycerol-3-phosphate acyltransferase [Candidatus Paceibacterota bacterium]